MVQNNVYLEHMCLTFSITGVTYIKIHHFACISQLIDVNLPKSMSIPAIVLYSATCRKIRNVIIAMVTPVVIKSYDK